MTGNNPSNTTPKTEDDKTILVKELLYKPLYELKHLVSVTQKNYQSLYLDFLEQVAGWLQALPHPTESHYQISYGALNLSIRRMITTLKHRRAYMLPPGANAETCYQQQDCWTYALFTAALLKDCAQIKSTNSSTVETAALAKQWIPKIGWQWLQRFKSIYDHWLPVVEGKTNTDNVIAAIIEKVETDLLHKPVPTVSSKLATFLYPTATQLPSEYIKLANNETDNAKSLLQTQSITPSENQKTAISPPENTLGNQFVAWLEKEMAQEQLVLNHMQDDEFGCIHLTQRGIFLIMPDIWEKFQADCPIPNSRWESLMENNKYFVRTDKNTFIHTYYVSDWNRSHIFNGLLLKTSLIFKSGIQPLINKQLIPDNEIN